LFKLKMKLSEWEIRRIDLTFEMPKKKCEGKSFLFSSRPFECRQIITYMYVWFVLKDKISIFDKSSKGTFSIWREAYTHNRWSNFGPLFSYEREIKQKRMVKYHSFSNFYCASMIVPRDHKLPQFQDYCFQFNFLILSIIHII
jgi:hypothetical protein